MTRNGALQFRRLLAMMMTLAMLFAGGAPALAASMWDQLALNILWTDSRGETHVFPAQPVPGSAERAYWAMMDPAALGQEVTLAAEHPDGRYAFFLMDEWGSPVNTFTWYHEMDAMSADYAFAHNVFYTTDGIPGDMPVYLYLSSASMPEEDTFVAFPVSVPVHYVTLDGTTLDVQYVECWAGETTPVWAASSSTDGYELVGTDTVQVTVDKAGYATPSEVWFTYRQNATPTPEPTEEPTPVPTEVPAPDPVMVDMVVNYYHVDLGLLDSQVVTLKEGTALVRANSSKTAGYEPVGSTSVEVAVFEDGTTHPGVVEFYYQDAYVAPVETTITVHYQDERGRDVTPAESFTVTGDGEYPITAQAELLPEGYELVPGLHTEVVVSVKNGVASQSDVYFYVQQKQSAPAMASVTVHYYDIHGAEIASAQSVTLSPGKHDLKPDATRIPRGYELATEASIEVTVYENGTFSPQEIGFYYQKSDEKTVSVTVYYLDDRGNEVATSTTEHLTNGTHTIYANPTDLKPGYELFPGVESTAEVVVRNGAATPSKVVFYYQKTATTPTYFDIPVFYKDTMGNQIADTQYVRVQPGQNYSVKAAPENLPAGAELMMEEDLPFSVFENGATEPEELAFYYRLSKQAEVTVSYTDDRGRLIADPFAVKLTPGTHTVQPESARVPEGYDPYSAKGVEVVVSAEGKATPREVVMVFRRQVVETPIPVGEDVNRYATVKSADVALRNEPTTSGGNKTVIKRMGKNSKVFVLQEMYNNKNEVWAMVNVDGRIGYMMSSYLDIMTQQGSDAYAAGSTPVPTFTPVPEATPTLEPLPHETATATPTASPTATPEPYTGYALTKRATALRNGVSTSDMTIIHTLEANELVSVIDQIIDPVTGEVWSIVSTLDNHPGYVLHSALREITEREAKPYIEYWVEANKTPEPTELVTATPEPPQMSGYGVVISEDVAFHQMESEQSRIIDVLEANTVVYVTGQTPGDGLYWHTVNYQGHWGYIRAELVRMMTIAEEEEYIESQRATPTPTQPPQSFDQYGMSSYGYVDASSVNWRQRPSKQAPNVEGRRELKRYALCVVLGSEYVDGVTWYHVSYGDKTGYIHGDFFKQMTIAELEGFLGSDEYLQGVTNNAGTLDEDFTGTGSIVSPDQWISDNTGSFPTFVPFNPIGTVQPIATASPTLEPLPGWATDAPTATPSPTPTFNPLPDVTYPTGDDGQGGSGVLWALVIGLLLLAGGGVFALVRYNQNRRRIALRAAQRRAQAARAQQMQQRPYARTGNPNQPRTGMYQQQAHRGEGQENPYAPYNGAQSYGTYFRPAEEGENEGGTPPSPQRPGRRTAYRQAQEARQQQENDDLNM